MFDLRTIVTVFSYSGRIRCLSYLRIFSNSHRSRGVGIVDVDVNEQAQDHQGRLLLI